MRRVSREYVFKLVFEYTFGGERNEDTLALLLSDAELEDEDRKFIRDTYYGVTASFDELKNKIAGRLERYTVDRVYRPDLTLLVIALYELEKGDTPDRVVINESVSLAKKYGAEKSGAFVNGVLAKFVK